MRIAVVVAIAGAFTGTANAGLISQTVPPAFEDTAGPNVFLGPMTIGPRTYQLLVHESLLTDLVGLDLTGISWRLPTSATVDWPAQDIAYANYDIRLSESVAPADRSLTFADNVVGAQSLVRSGGLAVSAGAFTSGDNPNAFAPSIGFDSNYLYSGGNLLVEIRHDGNGFGTRSVDAIGTSPATGYGSLFSAAWSSSNTETSGLQGNFTIFEFTAIPAPGAAAIFGFAALCACRRRRS
ncbi:MAG: hypothetical protein EA376_04880 [Phycisphaeraceae bacterium]|nr:MAG: hypothetical protein EA376_04880 [Phycisphaeraceae bacterium]